MVATVRRKWGLVALVFALGAIAAQLAAHHHATVGMTTLAHATAEGKVQQAEPIVQYPSS